MRNYAERKSNKLFRFEIILTEGYSVGTVNSIHCLKRLCTLIETTDRSVVFLYLSKELEVMNIQAIVIISV